MLRLHNWSDMLVRQRTAPANTVRGHFAEFGIVAPPGSRRIAVSAAKAVPVARRNWRRSAIIRFSPLPRANRGSTIMLDLSDRFVVNSS